MASFTDLPWNMPVPVRPAASYLPLLPEHASLGVVTDLGSIGSFGITTDPTWAEGLAAADMQTNLDVNAPGRLGSGRAVFYRGKYLKGVGRTPLAANWADPNDVYHHTGHLLPSAAGREFIVSLVARCLGCGDAIVPCEGVLIDKLDPRLHGLPEALRSKLPDQYRELRLQAADQALQAITVKPGQFARLSNLTWYWNTLIHATKDSFVVTAARLSHAAFTGFRNVPDAGLSPPVVVGALETAIRQGVANCLTFIAKGIFWGSFHNNFTADGRFLDLELPTLTGGNFLGVAMVRGDKLQTGQWSAQHLNVGTEVFRYIGESRLFIRYWENRLRWLAEWGSYLGSGERQFLLGLADCLHDTFTPDSLAFSRELVLDHLVGFFRERLALGTAEVQPLEQLLGEAYEVCFHDAEPQHQWNFERLEIDMPDVEPGLQLHLYYPSFLAGVQNRPLGRWQEEIGQTLRRIDSETRPEQWLDLLRTAQRQYNVSNQDIANSPGVPVS